MSTFKRVSLGEAHDMGKALCALAIVGFTALLGVPTQAQSQGKTKVLSDNPLQPAWMPIAEAFRRDSGHGVEYVFDTSPVVHKKVVDGETANVLILQPSFVAELVKSGKVVPGEHPVIGRVGFGS
jgi:ABC-type molybdate transport system substrate-binding protein